MKAKFTTSRIVNLVIGIGILLFISFIVLMFWSRPGNISDVASSGSSYDMNILPPIDPVIPDTLPHRKYVQLKDSIKRTRDFKNGSILSGFSSGGMIGFRTQLRCDTCNLHSMFQKETNKEYFISFSNWILDTTRSESYSPVVYFLKNDQAYLRKTFCKKNKEKQSKNYTYTTFTCNEKDIAIPFRIDNQFKSAMIEVNKSTYDIAVPVLMGIYVLFFIYFLYFVIGSFIQFLVEIAKGTPFSERNVKRLRFITLNLLFIPLGVFLINLLIIPLIFHSYFTPEIKLDDESWKSLGKPAVLCFIFAALYTAFKKGKQLKDESDLTV